MTLPRFLGIGAMKAGTTTLHAHLAAHPGVVVPTSRKEVMFFDRYWDRGLDWYTAHFPDHDDRVPGEVTPGYLMHPEAPARVAATLPGVRLIVVLRHPVDRAISQYRFFIKERAYPHDLARFLEEHPNAIARGRYAEQLERWLARVRREQLLVLYFDDLVGDTAATMARVYRHIGVDDTFVPPALGTRRNESAVPRFHALYTLGRRGIAWAYAHDLGWAVQLAKRTGLRRVFLRGRSRSDFAPIDPRTRADLHTAFADDIARLADLLGSPPPDSWLPPAHPGVYDRPSA